MRILLALHHKFDPNTGAAGATLSLGASLRTLGCEVEYFGFDEAFGDSGIPRGAWAILQFPWRLARFLRRRAGDFDVLDVAAGDSWVWAVCGRPGAKVPHALIARSHGLEHVVNRNLRASAVGADDEKLSWKFLLYRGGYREWEVRKSLLRSDLTIMLNDVDRDFAVTQLRVPREKIAVVPVGVGNVFQAAPEPGGATTGPIRCAFVGSWIARKGISVIVEAARLLETQAIDYRLTICGSRVSADAVLNSFPSPVRSRVNVIPTFEHSRLPELLANEEIFLFPSRSEGFGLSLLEAMACGLAPIATPVGGVPLLIRNARNGVIIPIDDARAIASAVARLGSDRSGLLEMRRGARSTALEYGWDRIGRRTLDLYESVLQARHDSRVTQQ